MKTKLALVKNPDRFKAIKESLELLGEPLEREIATKRNLVIKVNFVSSFNLLAATHVEAVRAFLDFVQPFYSRKIYITERGVIGSGQGFDNYGYRSQLKDYNVEIGNYESFGFEKIPLFDQRLELAETAYFSKAALESDFLVSIGPAKTHDTGVVTLSLKNVSVGFLKNPSIVHQGYRAFNKNLYLLAKKRVPDLSIIDATVAMEGNGPASGIGKKAGWVLVSPDSIQADVLATHLMGFEPHQVGYLHYLIEDGLATTDWRKLKILGSKISSCRMFFCPHRTYQEQLKWELPPDLRQKAEISVRKLFAKLKG